MGGRVGSCPRRITMTSTVRVNATDTSRASNKTSTFNMFTGGPACMCIDCTRAVSIRSIYRKIRSLPAWAKFEAVGVRGERERKE